MDNAQASRTRIGARVTALAIGALAALLLGSCAPKSPAPQSQTAEPAQASTGYPSGAAYTDRYSLDEIPEVATQADIDRLCLNCHLSSEADAWTSAEVTPEAVDSMLFPTFDSRNDPAIMERMDQSIARYFAEKAPAEATGK